MKIMTLGYLAGGLAFLGLDILWLGVMGNAFYRPQLGSLLLEKFVPGPAIAFYALYPIGIAVFAVAPAVQAGSAIHALGHGLLFGLLAYATYNLTNLSTLRGWSPAVAAVDTLWGAAVTGAAAAIGYWALKSLLRS